MNPPDVSSFLPARLAHAFGRPAASGRLKTFPEDFVVEEIPGFAPDGEGDHVFLTLRRQQMTTAGVARRLREFFGLGNRDIGYAGLKDKQALTTQTFSINLAGRSVGDLAGLESQGLQVIRCERHRRKLKRGVLKGNRFRLTIRDLQGDRHDLDQRLQKIARLGVPNYFGEQRFGHDGNNLNTAWRLFSEAGYSVKREQRGIVFSSVRSMIFNAVLQQRIIQDNWQELLDGEVIGLDGTQRHFLEPLDENLQQRAQALDVHPTGPLAGLPSRALEPLGQAGQIEKTVMQNFTPWIEGLQRFGLEQARRPLRLAVRSLRWQFAADTLKLEFSLAAGAYATMVVRELLDPDTSLQAVADG